MKKVTRFEDLDCWKAARELVKNIYHFTEEGPISRDWKLKDQLRSAALSSINNISEGFGRKSDRELSPNSGMNPNIEFRKFKLSTTIRAKFEVLE